MKHLHTCLLTLPFAALLATVACEDAAAPPAAESSAEEVRSENPAQPFPYPPDPPSVAAPAPGEGRADAAATVRDGAPPTVAAAAVTGASDATTGARDVDALGDPGLAGVPADAQIQPPPVLRPLDESRDLAAIKERGELRMLAPTNATTYFLYKGEPMGLEFELLRQFAEDNHVTLRVDVVADPTTLIDRLDRGEGDVAAGRLERSERLGERLSYTRPLYRADPVLVQLEHSVEKTDLPRAAKDAMSSDDASHGSAIAATRGEIEANLRLISNPAELAGERVDVPRNSEYKRTLIELADEISGDIQVVEVDAGDEALIKRVAEGQITFTVAHENLARLKETYFTNLRIKPVLGESYDIVWALPIGSKDLHAAIDVWLDAQEKTGRLQTLYRKYFADRRAFSERVESEYLTSETGKLSPFDELLKQHAPRLGWDWRLLASQAYQESRFDPKARSWAGAMGLLQLMPRTAKEVGVSNAFVPADNVAGAVRFLEALQKRWSKEIADADERLKFILASYNVGPGHVEDARRLAEKHGGNSQDWRTVSYWLLEKSKAKVAADPAVKYGYCRGIEPVMYVDRILERFDHYKQFVRTGRLRSPLYSSVMSSMLTVRSTPPLGS